MTLGKTSEATQPSSGSEEVEGKLFTSNLSYFCREEDLIAYFSTCGHVLQANINMKARKYKQPLHYGFVVMESRAVAEQAAAMFNGKLFMGRPMR